MSGRCGRSSLTRRAQIDNFIQDCTIAAKYRFESTGCCELAVVDGRGCELVDANTGGAGRVLNRSGIVLIGMSYRNCLNADQQRYKRYADKPTGLSEYAAHNYDNYDSNTES